MPGYHQVADTWFREEGAGSMRRHICVIGRLDASPEQDIQFGGDERCICCREGIEHSQRLHDRYMAQYYLEHP